ncbi:MAG: hypothetical protein FJX48_12985 [Alphaproteobacteria bacterium]|nr:hypothetical protein [Alphaproteobacteria bacterium]
MNANSDPIDPAGEAPIAVEAFYRYGYKGRPMLAIRAPFAMGAEGAEIVGRAIEADGRRYVVVSIARQISGPIHRGEPFGVELRVADAREGSAADR